MLSPKEAIEVADKLGIIEKLQAKFARRPEIAVAKLSEILRELSNVFEHCNQEVATFLSMSFSEPAKLDVISKLLIEYEGGALKARINSLRVPVSKVENIFHAYLNPWFRRILAQEENRLIHQLFDDLHGDEQDSLDLLTELTDTLSSESTILLDLIARGEIDMAETRIANLRQNTASFRRTLADLVSGLYMLEAEIIKSSGAV